MAKTILIVDDEPDIIKMVTFRLKAKGYTVFQAMDGPSAFDMLEYKKPDLILMDLRLPGLDGFKVSEKIKKNEKFKNIPVILITASTEVLDEEKMEKAGISDVILKPFDSEEFVKTVKKYI